MSCNNCYSCSCNNSSLVDISNVRELIQCHQYEAGDFFKIGNDIYKVVSGNACENCENYVNAYETEYFDCVDMKCNGINFTLFDQLDNEQN